jgi:hypothetical protein
MQNANKLKLISCLLLLLLLLLRSKYSAASCSRYNH